MKPPLRTFLLGLGLLSILNPQLSTIFAQGTAFTYQGVLTDAGAPANGVYDLTFTLFDAASGGGTVGTSNVVNDLGVTNGHFTVSLNFGSAPFDGSDRWIQVAVRPGASSGAYTTLTPRQQVASTPYAIRAANLSGTVAASQLTGTISSNNIGAGSITTTMLAAGAVGSNQLASGAVTSVALADGSVTAAKVATVTVPLSMTTFINPASAIDDNFGWSVAAVGTDWMLIGTPYRDTGATNAGAAYLFSANGELLTTFTNPAPAANDRFGFSVAAVGTDFVLIGAPYDDTGATDAGAAYLFSANDELFTVFTNPAPAANDRFGMSVAAVGTDFVLIGAPYDDAGATDAGAAYLFSADGTLVTTITNPTPESFEYFGYSMAVVGHDRVLIGAWNDKTLMWGEVGAAYLFSTNGTLVTTFNNPMWWSSGFGISVAAVGIDQVLIGANRDDAGMLDGGAAYLFGTNGMLLTAFTNPTPEWFDHFGHSVAAVGTDRVLIGTSGDSGESDTGAAYLFSTNGTLLTTVTNPTPEGDDRFGGCVSAVGSDLALIGAIGDNTGHRHAGAAYLFRFETYTPGLVADGVNARSITTVSIDDGAVTAAKIGGVLFESQIPELDASKITSGLFATNLIPNLDASKIVSGTFADARMSTNVARLNGTNAFTGTNRFAGVTLATNANNRLTGSFTGNGSGLTNLNAANLTGTISSNNIGAGSITTKMLAAGAVGSNQLAFGVIGPKHLASGAVTKDALADGAVTAAKVATAIVPLSMTAFTNPTPADFDLFGYAVAAVGTDRVLIGANGDDTGAADAGAAYLFGTNGALLTAFTNPTPSVNDLFGYSVAAAGADRVLIGATGDSTGEFHAGAAYLFSTNGALLGTFTNPAPASGDQFGSSLAGMGTDGVLVGTPWTRRGGESAGAAYLFSTNGTLLTTFTNPTPLEFDFFGHSMAALGTDRVLIGAHGDGTGATNAGAVYLFSTNGALLITFTNPTPAAFDAFGYSVAAVGKDRVLVGSIGDDTDALGVGAAYLFSTNGALLATFTNPTPATSDSFGYSVAAVGSDRVLVGAHQDDTGAGNAGAAYLFSTNGTLLATFLNPMPAEGDLFGISVAGVGDNRVLIGAYYDHAGATAPGAAFLMNVEVETYTPGLIADGVNARSISTASLEDGAVTTAKLDPTIGIWTRAGDDVFRATGKVGIGTSSFTSNRLEVAGMVGATAFNTTSDRAAKHDFTAVDAQAVLARVVGLPITQWRFKEFPGALHLGPMAQDFHAAFGLGLDDKHIATVDADGVALAAIQGLNQKLTDKEAELAAQREQIRSLQERLKSLEQLVSKLAQTK